LHRFHIRWEIARVFFPPADSVTNYCGGWDFSALARETSKTGFPASNASSFFACAKRCFKVSFGFADFFRFPFLEPVDRVLRRFN